jgi:methionyl-tRNA formyltransferase
MRIIFFGTPDFAVPSLEILASNGYEIAAVVTAPDRPSGRGQKISRSAIKEFALKQNFRILQPLKLKDPAFLGEIKSLKADLQIVVAFRMMPEALWSMPPFGTVNLHGSLLPQYRGAAPIQRAVMNGEKITGVTTFFLQQEVDTGKIIYRQQVQIGANETAGELHDRLMITGASLLLQTVKSIEEGNVIQIDQSEFIAEGEILHHAPKIFKEDCRLDFTNNAAEIYNKIRGLSPHPSAFFILKDNNVENNIKVITSKKEIEAGAVINKIYTDKKNFFKIGCADGLIDVQELQWPGKRKMSITEFLRGHYVEDTWKVV